MKKRIKELFQLKLDTDLRRLFIILSSICTLSFFLSALLWTTNPFWSSYLSNISVTCFSFLIAIFVIDFTLKKREERRWDSVKGVVSNSMKSFTFTTLYWFSYYLSNRPKDNVEFLDSLPDVDESSGNVLTVSLAQHLINNKEYLDLEKLTRSANFRDQIINDVNDLISYVDKMDLPEHLAKLIVLKKNFEELNNTIRYYKSNLESTNPEPNNKYYIPKMIDLFYKNVEILGELDLTSIKK